MGWRNGSTAISLRPPELYFTTNLPISHWFDDVSLSTFLINRLPSRNTSNLSPFFLLYNRHPDYSDLRSFGCRCYHFQPSTQHNKLSLNSPPCLFMGYSASHKGYICFNPVTTQYIISHHVTFVETSFPGYTSSNSSTTPTSSSDVYNPLLLVPQTSSTLSPTSTSRPTPLTPHPTSRPNTSTQLPTTSRSTYSPSTVGQSLQITSSPPSPEPLRLSLPRIHPMRTRSQSDITKPHQILSLLAPLVSSSDDITFKQASTLPHWQKAMEAEIQALQNQGT